MTLSIHLTQDWPLERLAKYGPELTAAMKKLVARFPEDVSLELLATEIRAGIQKLWLILDENDAFKAFVTSKTTTSAETGRTRVELCELGGEGGINLVELIKPIEEWARSIGADEINPVGRFGWRKELARLGYRPAVIRYRKVLKNGRD